LSHWIDEGRVAKPEDASGQQDLELIRRFRQGEQAAFELLVIRHQRRVYNLAFRVTGLPEEAQELAQEIFIKVYEKLDSFRGDAAFTTWLHQVAINHAKNRLKYLSRRQYFRSESVDQTVQGEDGDMTRQYESEAPTPEEELGSAQIQKEVQDKLAQLPEEQRIVVVLRDIEGLDYEEIAQITGLAVGTVKSRIHRGRLELKRKLAPLIREQGGL